MAKLKDTEIKGNLVVNGNVAGNLEVDGTVLTDNIRVTDDTNRGELSSTVPMAGCYDAEGGLDLFTTLQDRKSFIGSLYHPEGWFSVLSIRHKNGWGDGNKYGMMMWAPMTQDGNLSWSQQRSSGWKTAKTILDSVNVGSYALPITGGTISYSNAGNVHFPLILHQTSNSGATGWGPGIKFRNATDADTKWAGIAGIAHTAYSNHTVLDFYTSAVARYSMDDGAFVPKATSTYALGWDTSRWSNIYSVNALNTSSDRNLKKNINSLSDKYEALFNQLKPVSFERTFDGSDRVHVGFISQDVEESLNEVGLTAMDFAGFCKDAQTEDDRETKIVDEDGNPIYNYSLRYEEFIALNTHMIQKQQKEIEDLKDEISTLKEEINVLKELYKQGVKG